MRMGLAGLSRRRPSYHSLVAGQSGAIVELELIIRGLVGELADEPSRM